MKGEETHSCAGVAAVGARLDASNMRMVVRPKYWPAKSVSAKVKQDGIHTIRAPERAPRDSLQPWNSSKNALDHAVVDVWSGAGGREAETSDSSTDKCPTFLVVSAYHSCRSVMGSEALPSRPG